MCHPPKQLSREQTLDLVRECVMIADGAEIEGKVYVLFGYLVEHGQASCEEVCVEWFPVRALRDQIFAIKFSTIERLDAFLCSPETIRLFTGVNICDHCIGTGMGRVIIEGQPAVCQPCHGTGIDGAEE